MAETDTEYSRGRTPHLINLEPERKHKICVVCFDRKMKAEGKRNKKLLKNTIVPYHTEDYWF